LNLFVLIEIKDQIFMRELVEVVTQGPRLSEIDFPMMIGLRDHSIHGNARHDGGHADDGCQSDQSVDGKTHVSGSKTVGKPDHLPAFYSENQKQSLCTHFQGVTSYGSVKKTMAMPRFNRSTRATLGRTQRMFL
jgi:hypothetical protein